VRRGRRCDLEAVETAIKGAALSAGAHVLEALLQDVGVGRREEPVRCRCGQAMASAGVREKRVVTLLGPVRFARSLYRCPRCGETRYPGDEELGIERSSRSPGIQRQVSRLGAKEPFREVAQDMKELAGIELSRKDAERIAENTGEAMERWAKAERDEIRFAQPPPPEAAKTLDTLYIEFDGTGVPMVPREVAGRKGKQKDGSAKTREAKLGCVFTQTAFDKEGRPIRDPASTSFTGAIEPAAQFGWRIHTEAVRRGLFHAKRAVVLTDGAEWIRNLVQLHFPNATNIIDLYHAREHLMTLCKLLFWRNPDRLSRYKDRWWDALDDGDVETLVREARDALPKDPQAAQEARKEIDYFEKNKERMRYATFKGRGLFVGSGVIEAACKNLIGKRLKQSGMEWTVRGANAIIALRCTTLSGRQEDYWGKRAA